MYKVLLDENLPVKIKYRLLDICEVYTVSERGWSALENGELINTIINHSFDYLVTSDNNLQYQQNLSNYSLGFIVLNIQNNNYETILPLLEAVKKILLNKVKAKLKIVSYQPY